MKTLLTLAAFAALAAASSAQVANPGFETGDFTGWTTTNTSLLSVRANSTSFPSHSGGFEASFGTTSATAPTRSANPSPPQSGRPIG